jgi:AcrR family transcriptional regulator
MTTFCYAGPVQTEERRYHHGDLRSALLERAELTVRESGLDALSLRELARNIGVSHAAPRRHFRDRNALLDALAVAGFARLRGVLQESLSAGSDDFRDRVSRVALGYVRFATHNPALLELMFTGKHQAYASAELGAAADECFGLMLALVGEGQARGELNPGDLAAVSTVLFATLQGLAALTTGGMIEMDDLEKLTAYAVRTLLRGLAPAREHS